MTDDRYCELSHRQMILFSRLNATPSPMSKVKILAKMRAIANYLKLEERRERDVELNRRAIIDGYYDVPLKDRWYTQSCEANRYQLRIDKEEVSKCEK